MSWSLPLLFVTASAFTPFAWHGNPPPPPPSDPPGTGGHSGGSVPSPGGGTWSGPGDTTPSGPTTPSPGHPSGPNSGAPGAPAGPSTPNAPAGPSSGAPAGKPGASAPARTGGPGAGAQTGGDHFLDPTWDLWWHFHKEEFFDLKQRVHQGLSTSEGFARDAELAAQFSTSFQPSPEQILKEAAPVLREVLAKEHNNELVTSTLLAAGRLGEFPGTAANERLGPQVALSLRDPNQEISEVAALSLGILGSDDNLPLLEALLRDDELGRKAVASREVPMRTRSFAAYSLGVLAQHARSNRTRQVIARALTDMLSKREGVSTDTQVACVIALGLTPLDPERAESSSAPWVSRQTELNFLMQLFENPATKSLVRAHAATSLGELGADAAPETRTAVVELVSAALRRDQTEVAVRESCAMALGRLGDDDQDALDRRIRGELRRTLLSGSVGERAFALMSLSEIAARPGTGSEPGRGLVECRDVLLEELTRGRTRTRAWAALGLGVLENRLQRRGVEPTTSVREAVRKAFAGAAGPEEQSACAVALGLAGDVEGVKLLREKLEKGGDDVVRGYFALGIGLGGNRDLAPLLRTIAAESKYRPFLLQQTAIGLVLLGDKGLVPDLVAQLKTAQGQASQSWLAQAVGLVGDARTVPSLVAMVRDQGITDPARGYIAGALGIVCDKDPMPWYHALSSRVNWRAVTSTLLAGNGQGVLEIL